MTRKSGRFCLKTDVFRFLRLFFRGVASRRFSNVSFRKLFRFPANPTKFVIARRAQFLRPTRQSLTMQFVIPKRNMVGRNETKPWNKERGSETTRRIPFLQCGFPLASCSRASLRDAIPQTLRLPRPRCGLAMTQNRDGFIWKTDVFIFCGYFLRGAALRRFSNVSFQKLFRFSAKPTDFVIARRAQFLRPTRQSLTMRFVIP